MRIGDKVRMLHDNIEGVVIKIIDDKQVMIEDTMGFDFPVLKQDLIVVNPIEDKYFDKSEGQTVQAPIVTEHKTVVEKGIYVAVVNESKNYGLYLINNTGQTCFVACYAKNKNKFDLLDSKIIDSKSKYRASFFPLSTMESWDGLHFIFHSCVSTDEEPIVNKRVIKLKASKVIQAVDHIPFLEIKGYLKQLDDLTVPEIHNQEIKKVSSLDSLQQKMNDGGKSNIPSEKINKPKTEVDLHADKLGIDESQENSVVLNAQIKVFEESLESAIAYGMAEIVFVHGLGNGVLRKEIHKRMKSYAEIKFFEDAHKSRFGYGATKVVLK